jgi:branched-chain amino acid transport system permease protein
VVDVFLQQLVNGLMLGGTYALVAIGYSLVFGVLRLLHLAHGEVLMVGAFIGLQSVVWLGLGPVPALVTSFLLTALFGIALEKLTFRSIRKRGGNLIAPMVSTLGAGLVMQELATKGFGSDPVGFPAVVESAHHALGPVTISTVQIMIFAVSASAMVVLHLFVTRTRYGMAMRATSESLSTALLLGINVDNIIALTFAVASGLAGIAGVLIGLSFNAISPFMGVSMGIKGLAAMLIGGLGNIYGAMVGGVLIGVIEVMSVGYLASSYRDAFAFGMMILILILRPRGLFGTPYAMER